MEITRKISNALERYSVEITRKISHGLERYTLEIVVLGLLLMLYAPLISHWQRGWIYKSISLEHEYFSHGIIGLPFAAYIVWQNRHLWQALPNRSHPLGAALLGCGGVFYLSGVADLVNLSFPLVLIGLCLWLKGFSGLRLQGFPLLFVFLATPTEFPYLISPYVLFLQKFIAATAGLLLTQMGMEVTVEQINLFVGGEIVEVAPHCAGLKMLFTSLYVSIMLLYWTGAWISRLKTTLLLLSAVIISVVANIFRNTLLAFFHGTGQEQAFDWLHEGMGGDIYSICMLVSLVLMILLIDQFFDDLPEPEDELNQNASAAEDNHSKLL